MKPSPREFTNFLNKLLIPHIPNNYVEEFGNYRSIIICGNGINGYDKNNTKFIDDHECVVRINNVHKNDDLIGKKYQYLFAGGSTTSHLSLCDFYPTIKLFKTIISTRSVIKNISQAKKIKLNNVLYYDRPKIINFLSSTGYKKSALHISGIHCILFFLAVKQKFNIPIFNIIGFNKDNFCNESQLLYNYGEFKVNQKVQKHHNKHDWQYQNYLLDMINNIK